MRCIDADALIAQMEGDAEQISGRMINKSQLLAYLTTLAEYYSPSGIDINGRWVGGNEEVFYFIKALIQEVERW